MLQHRATAYATHRLLGKPVHVARDAHLLLNVLGAMLLEGFEHHPIAGGFVVLARDTFVVAVDAISVSEQQAQQKYSVRSLQERRSVMLSVAFAP